MLKKLGAILIVIFIIALSSMTVFAGYPDDYENWVPYAPARVQNVVSKEDLAREQFWSEYYNSLKDGKALDNDLSIITPKNPEKSYSSVYEKSFVLTGESVYKDVVVSVARLNRYKGEYELIKDTDGDTSWEVAAGILSQKIFLVDGVNNLMLISYRKSEMEAGKIQFNSFKVELLRERVAETAVSRRAINPESSIQSNIEFTIDMFGGRSK